MRLAPSAPSLFILALSIAACGAPPPKKQVAPPPLEPATPLSASASAAPVTAFVPKKVTLERGAMGTRIVMSSYTSETVDELTIGRAMSEAFGEIKRLENLMSTWVATSEVTRINESAGGPAVEVGPDTFAVIERSVKVAAESDGVFDITFEAMHGLWKFDEGAVAQVPAPDKIAEARKRIDYRTIELDGGKPSPPDAKAHTVRLKDKGRKINLGGIAKGYAVDMAARILEQRGVSAFFVQAGGDLYVKGRRFDGSPFRVGIRDPRGKDENDFFALMEVEDHAFSTAGDYERAFLLDGKRYHHIIDPRTGYPAASTRSVTVWAKDAFTADALDDAVFILGPEKGLALIEKTEGAGAVIVDAANKVWVSERLKKLVAQQRPPGDGP